jgi:predicted nucleic acid-binding protein
MVTKIVERIFTDTNVLVDATDIKRPRHRAAVALLERRRGLVFSAQVAREYLAVTTRPVEANGLGMTLPDALANLAELRRVLRLLPEERALLPALLALLEEVPCHGSGIHDALVVATMRVHRVRRLVTSNPGHFERFSRFVDVLELEAGVT